MYKPCFRIRERTRAAVFSLSTLLLFLTVTGLHENSLAQGVFSTSEQIYLKNITPLLYEFSQAASEVSATVLKLQSAPPEECASKFADYRGIVGSLSNQLGTITPPPRLETVREYSMQAVTDYLSGLELYFNACTEADFGVKESLVSQGGVYLNKSVATLGKAYGEIENLKAAGPAVVKKETTEEITEGEITAGLMEDAPPDEEGLKGESVDTADSGPPAPEVKTKAQVLEEISKKVQAEMDAQDAAQSEAPIPDSPVSESLPVAEPQEEASVPEAPKEEAWIKIPEKEETSRAPAVEPALAAPDTAEVKTEEAPSIEVSDKKKENAEAPTEVKTEEGSEGPEEETSAEDKIEKLNQKIMERSKAGDLNKDTGEVSPGESETPQTKVLNEGNGSEKSPGSVPAVNPAACPGQ